MICFAMKDYKVVTIFFTLLKHKIIFAVKGKKSIVYQKTIIFDCFFSSDILQYL